MIRATRRWYGVSGVAFLAAAAGILTREPPLLLAAAVGVAFAAYPRLTSPPEVDLDVERTLDDDSPAPGDEVEVTVRVRNVGGATLSDLRLVDGVPGAISVSSGSPRHGTALRPGKVTTFSYTIAAARGVHEFDPLTVIARDVSGAVERETTVGVDTTLECLPVFPADPPSVPLRAQAAQYAGPVAIPEGGPGVEFFATREYRPGDAMTRVDWSRLARTGDLATLEFRQERAATVVLVIDAREAAYVGGPDHGVERGVEAAAMAFAGLVADGHRVGLFGFALEPCWISPGVGRSHRDEVRRALAAHPAFSPTRPERSGTAVRRLRQLRRRLPSNAQVVVFSPLTDDYGPEIAARLDAHGHAATVVSPDVSGRETPGQRIARIERRDRVDRLRAAGIPVVDWGREEAFERALAVAEARR